MATKRKQKDERKEVTLEKRIDTLEKRVEKLQPQTYNLLVNIIQQQSQQIAQYQQYVQDTSEFIHMSSLEDDYKTWIEEQHQTKEVCEVCGGRGYIGDDEECPACHPNKNPKPTSEEDTSGA